MAKRKRIGLIFSYDENWIAGAYYIMNLIHALKTLPNKQKPHLVILGTKEEDLEKIREIHYPYISYKNITLTTVHYNLYERIINKFWRILKGHNLIEKKFKTTQVDYVFPFANHVAFSELEPYKKLYWIADFQEDYLPHFFSSQEVATRKAGQLGVSLSHNSIILSSQDALHDFQRLYSNATSPTYVLNFAVTHPDYQHIDIKALQEKYQINKDYFFSPNQFWQHKNHIIILEALKLLEVQGIDYQIVFTGKTQDNRNPNYYNELLGYISKNKLEEKVRMLGFIDRMEQLALMKHSVAVIQPSLFEGWSTVVEDAKAMSKFVILSDLKVHKEQLKENVLFFSPQSSLDLSTKIIQFIQSRPQEKPIDYQQHRITFAKSFMKLIYMIDNK